MATYKTKEERKPVPFEEYAPSDEVIAARQAAKDYAAQYPVGGSAQTQAQQLMEYFYLLKTLLISICLTLRKSFRKILILKIS